MEFINKVFHKLIYISRMCYVCLYYICICHINIIYIICSGVLFVYSECFVVNPIDRVKCPPFPLRRIWLVRVNGRRQRPLVARSDLAGFQKRLAEAPVLLSPNGFAHAWSTQAVLNRRALAAVRNQIRRQRPVTDYFHVLLLFLSYSLFYISRTRVIKLDIVCCRIFIYQSKIIESGHYV